MPAKQNSPGSAYLSAVLAAEAQCERDTDNWLKQAQGRRFPRAIDLLGQTLEIMEKAACCYWGCKTPSHDLERLTARIFNQATGALRLSRTGRYDEALSLVRSIGEFVNLLTLFALEPPKREEWQSFDDRKRRVEFAPVRVRLAIEAKHIEPPMDAEEYGDLCEQTVHPNPSALPGGYNAVHVPVLGGHLQPEGAIVVMCSLVRAVGRCAVVLSQLLTLPAEQSQSLVTFGAELEGSLGGHTAASMRERVKSLVSR
jgi:hypothetical protein